VAQRRHCGDGRHQPHFAYVRHRRTPEQLGQRAGSPERAEQRHHGSSFPRAPKTGDRMSCRWLRYVGTPYCPSIAVGRAGVVKASSHLCFRRAGVARYLLSARRQDLDHLAGSTCQQEFEESRQHQSVTAAGGDVCDGHHREAALVTPIENRRRAVGAALNGPGHEMRTEASNWSTSTALRSTGT